MECLELLKEASMRNTLIGIIGLLSIIFALCILVTTYYLEQFKDKPSDPFPKKTMQYFLIINFILLIGTLGGGGTYAGSLTTSSDIEKSEVCRK